MGELTSALFDYALLPGDLSENKRFTALLLFFTLVGVAMDAERGVLYEMASSSAPRGLACARENELGDNGVDTASFVRDTFFSHGTNVVSFMCCRLQGGHSLSLRLQLPPKNSGTRSTPPMMAASLVKLPRLTEPNIRTFARTRLGRIP